MYVFVVFFACFCSIFLHVAEVVLQRVLFCFFLQFFFASFFRKVFFFARFVFFCFVSLGGEFFFKKGWFLFPMGLIFFQRSFFFISKSFSFFQCFIFSSGLGANFFKCFFEFFHVFAMFFLCKGLSLFMLFFCNEVWFVFCEESLVFFHNFSQGVFFCNSFFSEGGGVCFSQRRLFCFF